MSRRWKLVFTLTTAILGCGGLQLMFAQAPAPVPTASAPNGWRPSGTGPAPSTAGAPTTPTSATPMMASRTTIARVTAGAGTLPNDGGQVWREYDITPYTLRVTTTARPEQALVDWILRETGYEAWHSDPLGILSANGRTLRVYHTPQMQEVVSEIVDRFVNTQAETHAFGMRIMTVNSPNWRAKMQRILRSIPVQTQGIQAWLLSKEDAAMLVAEMQKRNDFREHSSPHLLIPNGQSNVTAISRPRNYVKNVLLKPEVWPGFEPEVAQLQEGFSLEFKPLLSLDGSTIDAVIKCNIDQVEKMIPVTLDVPTPVAPRQRTQIEVPQTCSHRFAEKFHWPTEMVLLVSFGVVPTPTPQETGGVKIPLVGPADHADLMVMIESRGIAGKPPSVTRNLPPGTAVRGL